MRSIRVHPRPFGAVGLGHEVRPGLWTMAVRCHEVSPRVPINHCTLRRFDWMSGRLTSRSPSAGGGMRNAQCNGSAGLSAMSLGPGVVFSLWAVRDVLFVAL